MLVKCSTHTIVSIYHCFFARHLWHIVLEVVGWSFNFPNSIFDLLAFLFMFMGHPFNGTKRTIWLALVHAFFWALWGGRNGQLFRDSISTFDRLMDSVLTHVYN